MPLQMSFRVQYKGYTDEGHAKYDIFLKADQAGIAVLRDIPQPAILSGQELSSDFLPYNHDKTSRSRPDASPARVRRSITQQERRTAEALGGHRQTGSGARRGYKGDGRVEGRYRIENKMTRAASVRVHHSDLQKIRAECAAGEVPVFEVEFREKSTLRVKDKWAMVPWDVFERLANEAGDDS